MKENFIIHSKYANIKSELQEVLYQFSKIENYVVKGERNTIKKITIEGEVFNIKKFKVPNAFQSLVYSYIRKSKAKRSFEYAIKITNCGIKTPFPVAYYEAFSVGLKESYYISLHLDYDFDFRKLIHNPNWNNREEILKQFASFTFNLHENGINFLDHSPGNTLIVETDKGKFDFYLIDLNRMRFETLDFKKRMRNFRRMWLSKAMINIIAITYAGLYGKTESETHKLMTFYSRKFQKKVNSKKLRRKKKIRT